MISFSERHITHASVIYAQISNVDEMISAHGSKLMSKVADSISELLEESIREQNFASVVGAGRYAIIIPGVAAFKENVIVSRLQRAVAKLAFSFIDDADKLELAVGITSTESSDNKYLTFGEYCIQAQHALNMSLDSRNNHVVRFDETYEKQNLE